MPFEPGKEEKETPPADATISRGDLIEILKTIDWVKRQLQQALK
jgi:hypothetical protein